MCGGNVGRGTRASRTHGQRRLWIKDDYGVRRVREIYVESGSI